MGGGEPALFPRVDQRCRPAQCTGFAGQDIEVVVQHQVLPAFGGQPRMPRDLARSVQHQQFLRAEFRSDRLTDQPGGHRVERLADSDPRVAVHPGCRGQSDVELVHRQRCQ